MGDDLVRLDYEQTTQLIRTLTEIRFRLLAFVPTIAGAAVALLTNPDDAGRLLAAGLLGLAATLGIYLYELRNSQLYAAALERARMLEARVGFMPVLAEHGAGGLYTEAPREPVLLLGRVAAWHRRGLGLVYGAALAGWAYLVVWGALGLLDAPEARSLAGAAGAAVGLLAVGRVETAR